MIMDLFRGLINTIKDINNKNKKTIVFLIICIAAGFAIWTRTDGIVKYLFWLPSIVFFIYKGSTDKLVNENTELMCTNDYNKPYNIDIVQEPRIHKIERVTETIYYE